MAIVPKIPTPYQLQSPVTGNLYNDTGWMLDAPGETSPSLLKSVYTGGMFTDFGEEAGFYRFASWLPVQRWLEGSAAPVTYKSEGLAERLGLKKLYITFSGFWPEKKAFMKTCSFKETEAYSVCGRLPAKAEAVLVVASAGNTARSFARVCSDNRIPLLLCVPEDNLDALWFDAPVDPCVKLIVTEKGSNYTDAINLSGLACQVPGFFPEGGAKNIARRDGMATTVLSAALQIGRIPEYYFQAVGSGTGAIAAWEANLRLIADGRFGNRKMKLMVSQNAPFLLMYDAWKLRSRILPPLNDDEANRQIDAIDAKVLSNRKPPYSIHGGLFDALVDTQGEMYAVTNGEASSAARLFRETEGVDIHPAAAVAAASLIQATNHKEIPTDAITMLNITGGGEALFKSGRRLFYLEPSLVFPVNPSPVEVKNKLEKLFSF